MEVAAFVAALAVLVEGEKSEEQAQVLQVLLKVGTLDAPLGHFLLKVEETDVLDVHNA